MLIYFLFLTPVTCSVCSTLNTSIHKFDLHLQVAMHFLLAFMHAHLIVAYLPRIFRLQAVSSCVDAIPGLGNLQYIWETIVSLDPRCC